MKNLILIITLLCAVSGIGAQCLSVSNCVPNQSVCDLSTNDPQLWNETYWWDTNNQAPDLAETSVTTNALAVETCGGTISAKYLLFLDLDFNGTLETVIKSWEPPAPGTVNYNNYNNPNYNGGDVRVFDERAVAPNDKYQFAIETNAAGGIMSAKLRWNTPSNPTVFVDTELPYTNQIQHKIRWIFSDDLGNDAVCEYDLIMADCQNPTVVCLNNLSVNIMPTGQIVLWASDFLQYGQDNVTWPNLLEYGVRKCNQGSGFPLDANGEALKSVTFDCSELGNQCVEIWVKDLAGNADYCSTTVQIQDNQGFCGNGSGSEAPKVVCHSISVQLPSTGTIAINTADVFVSVSDINTPSNQIELGIRKCGQGVGFPVDGLGNAVQSISFDDTELGDQCVELWARDPEGNADFCSAYIDVQPYAGSSGDAPTLLCLNNLSVNIMPTGFIQLFASDFVQGVWDDLTPTNLIKLAIRKTGAGSGFPEDVQGNPLNMVQFSCSELGPQPVELWAKDLDGNTSYCETTVLIQDNLGNCMDAIPADKTLCFKRWCDNSPMSGLSVQVGNNAPFSVFDDSNIDQSGCYHVFPSISTPPATSYAFVPLKNNGWNNGVTPLDLVKISRHILGLEPLPAYGIIAADVNKSGSVTAFDLVEIRKLIQGLYQEFPNNKSWRFIDAGFVFSNPNNPFNTAFPEGIDIPSANLNTPAILNFFAIKVGDVDCDGNPGMSSPVHDRQVRHIDIADARIQAGESVDVPVMLNDAGSWVGMQLGFAFDPELVEIEAIIPGNLPGMDQDAFAQPEPGMLNLVWFNAREQELKAGETLFTLRLKSRQTLRLSEALQLTHGNPEKPRHLNSEGFDKQEKALDFALFFCGPDCGSVAGQHIINPAQPNPTSAGAHLNVLLTTAENVKLSLHDLSGKVIWKQEILLPSGNQQLDIPAESMQQPGIYWWKAQAGETVASGKLIKI